MNVFGENIKISIFGESHGEMLGVIIDGLPAGLLLDMTQIEAELKRRRSVSFAFATSRQEVDIPRIVSGMLDGKITGAPLCALFVNEQIATEEYNQFIPRPSHADLSAYLKFGGANDYRGGGIFSGRLTVLYVFAGAVIKQLLAFKNISIASHIASIGGVCDAQMCFDEQSVAILNSKIFPVCDEKQGELMQQEIKTAREQNDSVGGIIELVAINVPAGIGNGLFGSCEAKIASLMFAIPAVCGVEFGAGFKLAAMRGSQANDAIACENGKIITKTNHNGGINGGIANGMPISLRIAVKPTPSIARIQDSIDLRSKEPVKLLINGRHDPCIVPRAAVVAENMLAIALFDLLLSEREVF